MPVAIEQEGEWAPQTGCFGEKKISYPHQNSNPDTAVKLTGEFEVDTRRFLFLHSLQTENENRPASYRKDIYFSLEVEQPDHKTDDKSA
jgi:hypothetical protein